MSPPQPTRGSGWGSRGVWGCPLPSRLKSLEAANEFVGFYRATNRFWLTDKRFFLPLSNETVYKVASLRRLQVCCIHRVASHSYCQITPFTQSRIRTSGIAPNTDVVIPLAAPNCAMKRPCLRLNKLQFLDRLPSEITLCIYSNNIQLHLLLQGF